MVTALYALLLVVGIIVLIWAGTRVVRALTRIAHFFRVSEFLVSFVLMAFATTLPEFGVGVSAALSGNGALALGNVLGTNIVNLSLILGLVVLVGGGIVFNKREEKVFTYNSWYDLAFIAFPLLLLANGTLSRIEGVLLIGAFGIHMWRLAQARVLFFSHKPFSSGAPVIRGTRMIGYIDDILKSFGIFFGAAALLIGAAYAVVYSSQQLAYALSFPQVLFGIFVVALGTSLPELVFGIRAVQMHEGQASVGDLLGAAVLNSTWVLGVSALIRPIVVSSLGLFVPSIIFVMLVSSLAILFIRTGSSLSTREGISLISVYIVFLSIQLLTGM